MISNPIFQDTKVSKKTFKKQTNFSSQSDQFELEYHQIKKLGLSVNKKKLRVGNWTAQENMTYVQFLIENRSDFASEQERRKKKVFYRLSKVLKKRTPDQCRSHHQKLQMKFDDNVNKIIENMKTKLKRKQFCLFQNGQKKLDISQQKTRHTEAFTCFQGNEPEVLEEGSFYRMTRENQSHLSLQIYIDQIKAWQEA